MGIRITVEIDDKKYGTTFYSPEKSGSSKTDREMVRRGLATSIGTMVTATVNHHYGYLTIPEEN